MKRSKHSLSHYNLSTFNMGELIPVCVLDVLPGDSIRMQSSMLLRVSPLVTPVMHPVSVRLHHWFVPNRVLWPKEGEDPGFEAFITGGSDGEGDGAVFPQTGAFANGSGDLADYLGVPVGAVPNPGVSWLPFRAYNMIFNRRYRDQDLVAEVSQHSNVVQSVAWEKDQFTAARPWTQKGPAITVPIGGTVPVVSDGDTTAPRFVDTGVTTGNLQLRATSGSAVPAWQAAAAATANLTWADPGLEADLTSIGIDVNDVRSALALQRYQEARAQFGSRYSEYLRYLGVRSSDGRLQDPEYLGGGRATISFSEVLNTGGQDDGTDVPVGNMSGHGIAGMRTRPFVRFFEEHGLLMTLASVRPRSIYVNGLDRQFTKSTKEDFYQKELELIGQQEVYNREIRMTHASPNAVFGYNDRYYEYRHRPSIVTGQFRSTLSDWHFGRIFGSDPSLNAAFVTCDPGLRPFADQTVGSDHLWAMFSHSIQARRMVGNRVIGRVM